MLRPFQTTDSGCLSVVRPPLPARLLRRILIGGNHTIGQHVLIAGDHCGELAIWLDELGFDVEAIDDSSERLSATQRSGARFEIRFAKLDGSDDLANDPFDLIIADELNLHRNNLLSVRSRQATAELLAHLKPCGELVIVREPGNLGHHDIACWTRHLACFPGVLETYEYPTPWFSREMYDRLIRGVRTEPFLTISLKAPAERFTLQDWFQHAQQGLPMATATCCGEAQLNARQKAA